MMAMTDECCLNLAGKGRTLDDFRRLMERLASEAGTQYSYRNTLLAVTAGGEVAGAIVSYDGARLHGLREAFIEGARRELGVDHSGMDDETAPGEWYLDSLAGVPWTGRRPPSALRRRQPCRRPWAARRAACRQVQPQGRAALPLRRVRVCGGCHVGRTRDETAEDNLTFQIEFLKTCL